MVLTTTWVSDHTLPYTYNVAKYFVIAKKWYSLYDLHYTYNAAQNMVAELIINLRGCESKIYFTRHDRFIIIIIIIIFINCNWVVTRWQYTFTHKNNIEQHN